jgi:hypothetical protein
MSLTKKKLLRDNIEDYELIDYFYKRFIKSENYWEELRKRMIFARAHLCSSTLLRWGIRKNLIDEQKTKKIWELLTNNPESIDTYYVRNFGSGSMNRVEGRERATKKNFKELIELIQRTENFIKKDLEKGTEFEGEFEKEFPEFIKSEEKSWEHHEKKR